MKHHTTLNLSYKALDDQDGIYTIRSRRRSGKVRPRRAPAKLRAVISGRVAKDLVLSATDFTPALSRAALRYRKLRDRAVELLLLAAGLVAVFTTLAIVAILLIESSAFFEHVSIVEFLTGTMWTPLFADARYGILPLVAGTLTTTIVAVFIVGTICAFIAVYLGEFATSHVHHA